MNRSRSSVASGAAALLQKARGQSRGQFVVGSKSSNLGPQAQLQSQSVASAKNGNAEEDDIAAYLSQLSKKTSGIKKKQIKDDDLSSGLSDLSLSDEKGSGSRQDSFGSSQQLNKFMKKSATSVQESKSTTYSPARKETFARPSSAIVQRSSSKFTSSALQKASKLSAKISARKKGGPEPEDSDSSDHDVGKPPMGGKGRHNGSTADVTQPFDDDPAVRDGSRFLKKTSSKGAVSQPPPVASPASSVEEDYIGDKHGQMNPMTSTPLKYGGQKEQKKGSVYNRIMAQMDSDEDIEDLIGGVSSPEPAVSHAKKNQKEPKRAVTPYKRPEPASESEISEASGSIKSSTSEEIKVAKPMTVEDLAPVALDLSSVHSVQSVHSEDDTSIAEDVSLGPTLAGLQTIDDLLPRDSPTPTPRGQAKETPTPVIDTYRDDFESITASDRTVSPMTARSPSPKPVLVEETDTSRSNISSIHEVSDRSRTPTVPDSHSDVSTRSSMSYSKSYSRSSQSSRSSRHRSSRSRSSRRRGRHSDESERISRSYSESRGSPRTDRSIDSLDSKAKDASGYSEDFHTATHSDEDTLADTSTITSDFSTSHSRREASAASGSKHGKSRRHHQSHTSRKKGTDAAVQTSRSLHAMDQHWVKDINFQTPGYFKLLSANIHETLTHTVDPMVLQTLSSFDPTTLDLHASLAEQVRQTRLAVTNTLRQHKAFLDSLEENYKYTTLEDTKLFIKRQKKRRRREEEREAALMELDVNAEL